MNRLLLIALFGLLGSPLAAQDGSEASGTRTVEGAQTFLSQFYSRTRAEGGFGVLHQGSDWVPLGRDGPAGYKLAGLEGSIRDVRVLGRCRSEVSYSRLRTRLDSVHVPSVPLREPPEGLSRIIDWSAVQKVRVWPETRGGADGQSVKTGATLVSVDWKDGNLLFKHSDEADAQRAAFAMDFLREACGPKNDTGF